MGNEGFKTGQLGCKRFMLFSQSHTPVPKPGNDAGNWSEMWEMGLKNQYNSSFKNRKQNFVTHYMPNIVANLETGIDRGWHTCYYRSHSLITLNNVWKKKHNFDIINFNSFCFFLWD